MNRYQNGIGLLEVMIALVVFAIGVVGMAGLQLRTLSMSIDSTQRSIVIAKSQDLADRIRSSGTAPGDYVGTYNDSMCSTAPASVCADTGTANASNCNAAQMVTFDVWEVFCGNRSGLDGSVLQWNTVISCAGGCPAIGAQVTITTTWESRVADTSKQLADSTVSNADGSQESTLTDRLSLSFIP
jgi:type IV pilus assembly protein PilV